MQSCTLQTGHTSQNQSQVEHHSAADSNIADSWGEEEQPYQQEAHSQQPVLTLESERHQETPSNETTEEGRGHSPVRRPKFMWPRTNEKEAWRKFDQNLHAILGKSLRGSVTAKLNLFGSVIYAEGKEQFGEVVRKKITAREPGRWEREILRLVKERRLLTKAWRKAEESEKECMKALCGQLRERLATLRRAERIRRRRSRKEKERARFFRDPFRYAKGLLEEKKSGRLEASR